MNRRLLALLAEVDERAACRGLDAEGLEAYWLPTDHRDTAQQAALRLYAAQLCAGCPVVEACRRYAVEAGELYGVWGGTTEHDRRRLIRAHRQPETTQPAAAA